MTNAVPARHRGVKVVARRVRKGGSRPAEEGMDRSSWVVLNVRTGVLRFVAAESPATPPAETEPAESLPGYQVRWGGAEQWSAPVPDELRWRINYVSEGERTLSAVEANALTASLVPTAQLLVDGLFKVGGTADLEWSAQSAAAMRAMMLQCASTAGADIVELHELFVDYHQAVRRCPGLVRAEWCLQLDDVHVDRWCEGATATQLSQPWRSTLRREFAPFAPYEAPVQLFGARSWAYAYRGRGGAVTESADLWFQRARRNVIRGVATFVLGMAAAIPWHETPVAVIGPFVVLLLTAAFGICAGYCFGRFEGHPDLRQADVWVLAQRKR